MAIAINTAQLKAACAGLSAGCEVLISGTVYTSRDAAHKRIMKAVAEHQPLPYQIDGAVIYYAGPTPSKPGMVIGSCGPTTSSRMDIYTPALLDLGLAGMIGKGPRSKEVREAIIRDHAVYFCALGGCGALAAEHITSLEVIAYPELGCESVKKLTLKDFPAIIGIAPDGSSLFK